MAGCWEFNLRPPTKPSLCPQNFYLKKKNSYRPTLAMSEVVIYPIFYGLQESKVVAVYQYLHTKLKLL